jgi:hypothetical protein
MKQVLNIFKKDVRHYWHEIVVSISLLAAFAWYDVRSWANGGLVGYAYEAGSFFFDSRFLSGLVDVLLPISWAFVIVRVIQGESLVGDRQFWVTRPYEWKKLLAAKILFILVFINFPLLVADVILLAKAGFQPTHYVVGLLWMQAMIALGLLLIAAMAAVTASVVHFGLALLVVVLYLIGMGSLSEQIPSSSFSSSIGDAVQTALLIATPLVVILLQYSRRKTAKSRLLIVGFAAVLLLILVGTPYRKVVAHQYPRLEARQQSPVQLALLPPEKQNHGNAPSSEKEVEIVIPFSVSGIDDDSIVTVSGVMVAIEAPDGLRWNSGWRTLGWSLFREDKSIAIRFTLKKKLFERIKSQPVKAEISLALTVSRDQNRTEFVVPQGEFVLPDVGFCAARRLSYEPDIECRSALRTPSSLLVTYDISQTSCPGMEGQAHAKPGEISRYWHSHSDSGPAEFGISPIKTTRFGTVNNASNARAISGFCPGTPVILSNPELVRRTRIELELNDFHLGDYQDRSMRGSTWR